MSNQTSSPTNLNSELESSTESTINHLRDESNSELPSAIRQSNDSDFSQNHCSDGLLMGDSNSCHHVDDYLLTP